MMLLGDGEGGEHLRNVVLGLLLEIPVTDQLREVVGLVPVHRLDDLPFAVAGRAGAAQGEEPLLEADLAAAAAAAAAAARLAKSAWRLAAAAAAEVAGEPGPRLCGGSP